MLYSGSKVSEGTGLLEEIRGTNEVRPEVEGSLDYVRLVQSQISTMAKAHHSCWLGNPCKLLAAMLNLAAWRRRAGT